MARTLMSLVERATRYILSSIGESYEKDLYSEQNLPFHTRQHTRDVIRRATLLAHAMELSSDHVQLVKLAAAFHDAVVIRIALVHSQEILADRNCNSEMNSVLYLFKWLDHYDDRRLVGEEYRQLMAQAIMVTFPGRDHQHRTAVQPKLTANSHPVVRCVALADLGSAGMDGSFFLEELDLRFREKYPDIETALNHAENRCDLSLALQKEYREKMLEWLHSQKDFIIGRRVRLDSELGNLKEQIKERVRRLFCHFDDALDAVTQAIDSRQHHDVWQIAKEMGYDIPLQ